MALISLYNASVQFGGPLLLDDVTLHIERGERACLVGRNGTGKSTLLRILSGEIEPDGGMVQAAPGARVAYLPQEIPREISGSVRSVVESGASRSADTEDWEHAGLADQAMSRLHLDPSAEFSVLSGGMKRRAMLARALVCEPDILLLDEPTNHLDIASIEWLEGFLKRYIETILFVTHDRRFVRSLATRILDLDRGALAGWSCDYDTFLRRKEQLLEDEATEWARKSKLLSREEKWIRKGIRARRTRDEGRVRALERLRGDFAERRVADGSSRIKLMNSERSGNLIVRAEDVNFAYPDSDLLIKDLTVNIQRGERVGIIGPNGAGKTTLLRLLCGDLLPTGGMLKLGTRLDIAYFDQLRSSLDPDKTVAWNVAHERELVDVGGQSRHILGYLQDFLFTPERARTPVGVLSGGERNRLLIARLFLEPSNLLVMDEPTNDLDSETLDLLEEQVQQYAGTVLLVSHDRAFLNNVVTSTIVFDDKGGLDVYAGGYDDWLRQRPEVIVEKRSSPAENGNPSATKTRDRKLGFNEKRELKKLPDSILALEMERDELHEKLCSPEFFKEAPSVIAEMQQRTLHVEKELEQLVERWVELEELT